MIERPVPSDASIIAYLAAGYGSEDIAIILGVPRQRVSDVIRSLRAAGKLPITKSEGAAA